MFFTERVSLQHSIHTRGGDGGRYCVCKGFVKVCVNCSAAVLC